MLKTNNFMGLVKKYFLVIFGMSAVTLALLALALTPQLMLAWKQATSTSTALLKKALSDQFLEQGAALAHSIAEAAITPLMLREQDKLQSLLASHPEEAPIVEIIVVDDRGEVFCRFATPLCEIPLSPDKLALFTQSQEQVFHSAASDISPNSTLPYHVFSAPILLDGRHRLGSLVLALSMDDIHARSLELRNAMASLQQDSQKQALLLYGLIALLVLALAATLSRWVARGISTPILRMAAELTHAHDANTPMELPRNRSDEIGALARSIDEMVERSRASEALKSQLVTSVSHELRTPLTSILGFSKLIRKAFSKHIMPTCSIEAPHCRRILENLDIIETEANRLSALINDMLDLDKIEAGRMVWRFARYDLGKVCQRAFDAMAGAIEHQHAISFTLDVEPGLPKVIMDDERIMQVCINLLSNALKFTQEGQVVMTVRRRPPSPPPKRSAKETVPVPGRYVYFSVQDTGPGIAPAAQATLFERFVQADSGQLTNKPKGTGLGLALCREIVEHHDGHIWMESTVGKGTTFTVALPVRGPAAK